MAADQPPRLADELLAASIHEIKNHFGTLFGQLDQLLETLPLDDQQSHSAERIKAEAQFIGSELVRVLTSYRAITSDDNRPMVSQQFLEDFLEEKVARHANTSRAHDLELDFDCEEDLEGFFDPGILNVILDTCIYNSINAGAKRILMVAHQPDGFLNIEIHDDGPGFPESMLKGPITPGSVNTDSKSTGLGLYFAHKLISSHEEGAKKGNLRLNTSERMSGACVQLLIPQ